MKSVFDSPDQCCGCGVCENVCPTGAITMKMDDCGFIYPTIDEHKCVDCRMCVNRCHYITDKMVFRPPINYFVVQSKDDSILKTSQSGGLFTQLARIVMSGVGAIYGAAFDENFHVSHVRITSRNELYRLQGSKYVQSRTEGVFKQVKEDLDSGISVIFSGTPCQVAALNAYLGKRYDSLFTVDLLCHGVMPPSLWEDYLQLISDRYGEITQAVFRDKSYGWRSHNETFVAGGRKVKKNIYRKIFYKNVLLRPCCYSKAPEGNITACRYAGMQRVSDMTIGDYWGAQPVGASFPDPERGLSVCIINTKMGQELFDCIKPDLIWQSVSESEVASNQPHLLRNAKPIPAKDTENARKTYSLKGFRAVASEYGEYGIRGVFPKSVRLVKFLSKKVLKKIGYKPERKGSTC